MFRNYLLISIRALAKNQLFALINIGGLAISVACVIVIYLYVKNELTYDAFHEHSERLFILGEGDKRGANENEASYYQTVFPSLPKLMEDFPEIESGIRIFDWDSHVLVYEDKKFLHDVLSVDPDFFRVLTFPLLHGNPSTALSGKGNMVISADIASKLFDTTDVLGRVVSVEDGKEYTISGVLEPVPANSSFKPEVLLSLEEKTDSKDFEQLGDWFNTICQVIIKLRPDADIEQTRAKFPGFVKMYFDEAAKDRILKALPITQYHKATTGNQKLIYGLSSVALFILLLAVINFINLSIASSLKRLRETGLRKVMGSRRTQIVVQFLVESLLLSISAACLGFVLIQTFLPMLNNVLEMPLTLKDHLTDILLLCFSIAFLAGFIAGGYPALYLTSFKMVNAIKGNIQNISNKATVQNTLVVTQFVVAVSMIIGIIVTASQIHFMKSRDLKFDHENILVVRLSIGYKDEKTAWGKINGIVNNLRNDSRVLSVCLSQNVPGRYWENYNGFKMEGSPDVKGLRQANVDDQYINTYQINITEGRNFSRDILSDTMNAVLINQAAVKAYGLESAVGKTLTANGSNDHFTIVGVTEDFHYRSLQGSVQPLVHFYSNKGAENSNFLSIKIASGATREMLNQLQNQWKELGSWIDFDYFFIDEEFDKQYKPVVQTLWLITLFAGIAILISCAGIFALSAISAQKRVKEIGIRKVLGASVANIVSLLSSDFLKLVILAILLAIPLAWYGMNLWLQDFAYKISLSWWIFAGAGIIAILIALFTVSAQVIKAAWGNPAESLRNE